jgi:hypothetical protein
MNNTRIKTYSIFFKGSKKSWLREQIGLARICAHEVPLDRAQVVFVSPQAIRKLPRQGFITAIIPTQRKLTLAEEDEVQAAVGEGRVQIAVPYLNENLRVTLKHWFPPITSCHDVSLSTAV